tara:strand:+ start:2527 stop:6096 length:3570 start_codon:yes stop_codon:yes gene_type:complete
MIDPYSSFLPDIAVQQLRRTGAPYARDVSDAIPGQIGEAAMIFADASGFTALTEKLAARPDGAERMCEIMNRFLGAIIDIVHSHCGDVVKFAGDAVSVTFPVATKVEGQYGAMRYQADGGSRPAASDMRSAVARATRCACVLHEKLHMFKGWEDENGAITLSLHIGVGCGTVTMLHLGGDGHRWEYVLGGPPVSQSADAEPLAKSGETCMSPQSFALVKDIVVATELPESAGHPGFMLVSEVTDTMACMLPSFDGPQKPLGLSRQELGVLVPALVQYVPHAVRGKLQQGICSNIDLSEMRSVSVMFINCMGLKVEADAAGDCSQCMQAGQTVMTSVQEVIHGQEGQVNKMLVDDKGTVLLCVFGLPPRPHPNDAWRALRAAFALQSLFDGTGEPGSVKACIGIGTGRAFCGVVGSTQRREFTTMGDVVNVSARLMGQASKPNAGYRIYCDEATSQEGKSQVNSVYFIFKMLPAVKLKGKANALSIFAPVGTKETKRGNSTVGYQGRDAEYRLIKSLVAELLLYNRGGTLMLLGGRGSGKGVLVKALEEYAVKGSLLLLTAKVSEDDNAKATSAAGGARASKALRRGSLAVGAGAPRAYRPDWFVDALDAITLEEEEAGCSHEGLSFSAWREVVGSLLQKSKAAVTMGQAELVKLALAAEEAYQEKNGDSRKDSRDTPRSPRVSLGRAERATFSEKAANVSTVSEPPVRGMELVKRAWLLNELLDEKHTVLVQPTKDDAPMSLTDCCWYVQAMIVGLLRFVSCGGQGLVGQASMVLIHMQTGTSATQRVDLWSWRTASALSTQCAAGKMNMLFAVVTRQQTPLSQDESSDSRYDVHVELHRRFEDLSLDAEQSSSKIVLYPLGVKERDRYMVEVLKAKHGYPGELSGVPEDLRQFMSERGAGNPKYIKEMLDAVKDAGMLEFEVPGLDVDEEVTEPRVKPLKRAELLTVPTPSKIKGTVMQQFDTLDTALQMALKVASPCYFFSVGMFADVGLPPHVVKSLTRCFTTAVDDGILEEVSPVPHEVASADPGATRAYGWLLHVMREAVLASLLHSERERVEQKIQQLQQYAIQKAQRQASTRLSLNSFKPLASQQSLKLTSSESLAEVTSLTSLTDALVTPAVELPKPSLVQTLAACVGFGRPVPQLPIPSRAYVDSWKNSRMEELQDQLTQTLVENQRLKILLERARLAKE